MSETTITTKGMQHKYYRCSKVIHGVCSQRLINEKSIDSAFLKTLETIQENLKINSVSKEIDRNSTKKQLKAIEGKRVRIRELYIEGELKRHEYDEKIRELNDKKESSILSLEKANKEASQEEILNIVSEMQKSWELWPDEAKAKIMRCLFDEIHFEQRNKREISIINYKFI
ncbi:hypothetical protein [Bacillus cereus]|uniref:hypothetical protein n=1 Tax=Bacillus cereus TaxID=1396 RepID=UPI000BF853AA|nr:hypothetical protein [Bacillus cereus]PER91144.1 hypothetical protein CN500_29460 [Bacillus cereus]